MVSKNHSKILPTKSYWKTFLVRELLSYQECSFTSESTKTILFKNYKYQIHQQQSYTVSDFFLQQVFMMSSKLASDEVRTNVIFRFCYLL